MPNSSSARAAGCIVGQSESLPMTMPTIGSLMRCSWSPTSVLVLEGEGVVDDAVGQVAGGGDGPRANLGQVLPQRRDVAELAAGPLSLAVPVQLDVGPVRHEVMDALVQAGSCPARLRRRTPEHVRH